MDTHLTDLDAIALTVRNSLSRSYIEESIKAYRSGCYKSSIVSIWVAVTFDIIEKIREISDQGDKAAALFVATLDANIKTGNVKKLLEIEGSLLEEAEGKFGFIDLIVRRHFERLYADRNLCAHPAFTVEGQLFSPEPELVRLYIVEAIRNLLSQQPVHGKTILELFDREFKSNSFPTKLDDVRMFVRNRYLNNSKRSVHSSLAQVVSKALLKQPPTGWESKLNLLPYVLQAIKDNDLGLWDQNIRMPIVNLIDAAEDAYLPGSYAILMQFNDVYKSLGQTAKTRLTAIIQNKASNDPDIRAFQAAGIPDFAATAVQKFVTMERSVQVAVISAYPYSPYWLPALSNLGNASSFRGAEALISDFILPFRSTGTPKQLTDLLYVVRSNGQILHASAVPIGIATFARGVQARHTLLLEHISEFLEHLDDINLRSSYKSLLDVFIEAGVVVPAKRKNDDDEDE